MENDGGAIVSGVVDQSLLLNKGEIGFNVSMNGQ